MGKLLEIKRVMGRQNQPISVDIDTIKNVVKGVMPTVCRINLKSGNFFEAVGSKEEVEQKIKDLKNGTDQSTQNEGTE